MYKTTSESNYLKKKIDESFTNLKRIILKFDCLGSKKFNLVFKDFFFLNVSLRGAKLIENKFL